MKLKKLFSLSLAAAMLLSTAALPVAAGDDGAYTSFYYDFENVTSATGNLDNIITMGSNGVQQAAWTSTRYTTIGDDDANRALVLKTTSFDRKWVESGESGSYTNEMQTQLNINTNFNQNTYNGDAVFGFSAYVSDDSQVGINAKGLSNKWYGDKTTTNESTKYYYDSVANLISFTGKMVEFKGGTRTHDENGTTEKGTNTDHTVTFDEDKWHHFVISFDWGARTSDENTVIRMWCDGRLESTLNVENDMQGITYFQFNMTTPDTDIKDSTKQSTEEGYYYTVNDLSGVTQPSTVYQVGIDNVFAYCTSNVSEPTYTTDIKSTDKSYTIDFGQKVFGVEVGSDKTLDVLATLTRTDLEDDKQSHARVYADAITSDEWKDSVSLTVNPMDGDVKKLESDATYQLAINATDAFGNEITLPDNGTVKTETTYAITASCDSNKGTVTITDEDGNPITRATAGTKVYAKATPKDGYVFAGWSSDNTWTQGNKTYYDTKYAANSTNIVSDAFADGCWMQNPIKYTLPEKNVTLTASFIQATAAYHYDGSSAPSQPAFFGCKGYTLVTEDLDGHDKYLKIEHTYHKNTDTNTYEGTEGFIQPRVMIDENAVFGYSFYAPASDSDATAVDTTWSGAGGDGKGMSGEWGKKDAIDKFIGVSKGVLHYASGTKGSSDYQNVDWKDGDKNKLTPGWHNIIAAIDVSAKSISYYIDDQYLSTAYYPDMNAIYYLNFNGGYGTTNYYDDIFLYYPADKNAPTDKGTVAHGETTYTVDFGQKVEWSDDTIPVEVKNGSTRIATTATVERGVLSDKVNLTFASGLEAGTYTVYFDGVTDLLGNELCEDSMVGFTVMPQDAKLVNTKFTANEGGKIKVTVGEGDNSKTTIVENNNTMTLWKDAKVKIEAVNNSGYYFKTWTATNVTLPNTRAYTSNFTVGENDIEITATWEKALNVSAFYQTFDSLPANNNRPYSYNGILGKVDENDAHGNSLTWTATSTKNTFQPYAQTDKNVVYGLSFYAKDNTQVVDDSEDTTIVNMSLKSDAPNTWELPGSVQKVFQVLQTKGTTDWVAAAFGTKTTVAVSKNAWHNVIIGMDYENHTITVWMDGQQLGSQQQTDEWVYTTRYLLETYNATYFVDDVFLYYPGEADAVTAANEVETHTTEYVIDMGQKVFNTDEVGLYVGESKAGCDVTVVSDGYKDSIKLTFDESLLDAGKTYTVELDGVKDAYGATPFANKTFTVNAKSVKVTMEPGNTGMGRVDISGAPAGSSSGSNIPEGTKIDVTPVATTGYEFAEWDISGLKTEKDSKSAVQSNGDYFIDASTNVITFVVPHDSDVDVKAIFKNTKENGTKPYFYDFEDYTSGEKVINDAKVFTYLANIANTELADAYEVKTLDDGHGKAVYFNWASKKYTEKNTEKTQTNTFSSFVETYNQAVYGFSFKNTADDSTLSINAYNEKKWTADNPGNISGILKLNAKTKDDTAPTVSVLGSSKKVNCVKDEWHNVAIAVDVPSRKIIVWFDGEKLTTYEAKDNWDYNARFKIDVSKIYIDDMFLYNAGGNDYAESVNVKAGTNTWTFDVGEMLYDATAAVEEDGSAVGVTVAYVDKYNYEVTLNHSNTWEDEKTYTVKISGKDAFGNPVTKEITADARQMYTVTLVAKTDTMGSVSIVDKKDAYAQGEKFTVQATIKDTDKYSFKGWSVTGGNAQIKSDDNDKTKATVFVDNGDLVVTATFQEIPHNDVTLSVNESTMGSVSANTWSATDKRWSGEITQLKPGTQVRVKAAPATGYKFKEWEVSGVGLTETQKTQNALVFDMGNDAVSVKAVFEKYEGTQPANTLPFYWDFETAKAHGYGTQSGFFIDNTGWSDSNETIYTTTAYTDAEHGRSLVMGPQAPTHFVSIAAPCESGKNIVFGYEALVDSAAGSSFGFSSKQSSGQWTGLFSASGNTVKTSQVYKNEKGELQNRDSKSDTVTDGWHKFAFAFDLANDTIYVYIDGKLFDAVREEYDLVEQIGFNLTNFCWNTAFDNMFAYYVDDARLTGEDNVKHEIDTYSITTGQLLYDEKTSESEAVLKKAGETNGEQVPFTITTDKATSTITMTVARNTGSLTPTYLLEADTEYEVTFPTLKTLTGAALPKYTFKTRSDKPTITVKDATTYAGTLPQDAVTDIEVTALNIANDQTLTVYQNGAAIKTLTVSGVTEGDMSYKATVEVTLQGGENKFEVVWGETKGETTIKARKFSTLSTVIDTDLEGDNPKSAFGTVQNADGTITVEDIGGAHGKVFKVNLEEGKNSPYITSPGSGSATSGVIVSEADFCFTSDTYKTGIFDIKDNSGLWCSQFGVENGVVKIFSTTIENVTIKKNEWYRLKHLVDIDNGMIYYFINGRLIAEHTYQVLNDKVLQAANGFQYWNQKPGATGTRYLVDNVKMYRYAEAADFTVTGYGGTERVGVNGTICVNFTQTMDASTLENITITDESGNVVQKLTEGLENDGKTYAITVNGLNYNAPYTVTVPATVKTTSGASNADAKATIWTEKADFSIGSASLNADKTVSVTLNGSTSDDGYIVVYAYAGTKMIDLQTAKVKDGAITGTLAALDISGAAGKTVTYGAALLQGEFGNLKCIDFIKVGEIK